MSTTNISGIVTKCSLSGSRPMTLWLVVDQWLIAFSASPLGEVLRGDLDDRHDLV